MEDIGNWRDGLRAQIWWIPGEHHDGGSKQVGVGNRLKKQLDVLNLGKVLRQLRCFGIVVFTRRQLFHKGTFALAMQVGLVLVFALGDVSCTVPLVVQSPGSTDGCLAEYAAEKQYGNKPLHEHHKGTAQVSVKASLNVPMGYN